MLKLNLREVINKKKGEKKDEKETQKFFWGGFWGCVFFCANPEYFKKIPTADS